MRTPLLRGQVRGAGRTGGGHAACSPGLRDRDGFGSSPSGYICRAALRCPIRLEIRTVVITADLITRSFFETSPKNGAFHPLELSLFARDKWATAETKRVWPETAGGGRQFDRGGVSLVLPNARQRCGGEDRNLLRELAIRRKKPWGLPSAWFVHPRVAELRNSEFQVAGTGFEPVTSRL